MANQSSSNVTAAIKREVTFGTPAASGAGATVLPLIDSPGMTLNRGQIRSARRRRDMIMAMGRLGAKTSNGTFNTELLPGNPIDQLLESLCRNNFATPVTTGSVSMTTTATAFVRTTGSFVTDGFKIGDIVTATGDSTTANNNLRSRVTNVVALTLTVNAIPPLTLNATPRAFTVARLKKVTTPAVPINFSYSVEQNDGDIDESELFIGTRLIGATWNMQPNAPVTCAWQFQGVDRNLINNASAPYYTSPAELTGDSLIADDSWISYKGVDIVSLTGFEVNWPINAATQPTIGSIVSPDVFMNDMTPAGTVTAIRQNLLALADFDAETEFDMSVLLRAPGADPKPVIGIYWPRVKISGIDAPFLGGDAAKVETRELMIATHAGSSIIDASAFNFFTSTP